MKFKKFLLENKTLKKEIELAKKALVKREKINPKYLQYIGFTDVRDLGMGVQYNFNILDPKHPRYNSTIVWNIL